MPEHAISLRDVQQAAQRIRSGVLRTPCVASESLSRQLGCQLHLKAENLQHVGAFKARGALNAVLMLNPAIAERGVVTHSSGNHAAALARAASLRGIAAHIVMPQNAASNKIEAVRRVGIEPVFCAPTAPAREQTARRLQAETGATLIHPYNDPRVMAGQGTVGLELLEQLPKLEVLIAPVGGGGLLSGLLTCIKALKPDVQVVAAEPELADDAYRSVQSNSLQMPTRYDTVADGLRTPLGTHTFPIIRDLVDEILLVSEAMIRTATRNLAEMARLVSEPSGAVALAVVMQYSERFLGKQVAAIVSGGNLNFGSCRLGQAD